MEQELREDIGDLFKNLHDDEHFLLSLFDHLRVSKYRCLNDGNWTLEYIDHAAHEVLGFKSSDLINNESVSFKSLFHPEDELKRATQIQSSLLQQEPYSTVYRIRLPDNEIRWIYERGTGEFTSKGQLIGIEGLLSDITTYKTVSDDLIEKKNFLENTLDMMPFELVILNKDHKYIYCNKTAIADDDIRNWLIGKDDFQYCRERRKDINIAKLRRIKFNEVVTKRKEIEWEEAINDAKGNPVYSLKRLSPIYSTKGDLLMIIGYGVNITEHKVAERKVQESERLLHTINSNIQEAVYRSSPDRGLLYINQAMASTFGYPTIDEAMKINLFDFYFDPQQRKEVMKKLETKGRITKEEIIFKRKDNSVFYGLLSAVRTIDENGDVIIDGAIVDISGIKEAQKMLVNKNNELQKLNRELDRFVYSASHDLRAPLTSVMGVIKLAKLENQDSGQNEYLDIIQENIENLDNFILEIVNYSRNTRQEIKKERISFKKTIQQSLDSLKFTQNFDKIDIRIKVGRGIKFYSDASRLKVILNNLIGNAIKYHDMKKSSPFIEIAVREESTGIALIIKDNGSGIEHKHLDKIFDMFYTASVNGTVGSGIGLYIVKETVEKLNGQIVVNSKYGEGTTFKIELSNI